jgi:hypothetical protein
MWQLEQQWAANREKLTQLEQQNAEGMNISEQRLDEARRRIEMDKAHAAAIEQAKAQKQAAADAEEKRIEERRQANVQAALDTFLRRARLSFASDADFEAAKPELIKQWSVRQALADTDSMPTPRIRL